MVVDYRAALEIMRPALAQIVPHLNVTTNQAFLLRVDDGASSPPTNPSRFVVKEAVERKKRKKGRKKERKYRETRAICGASQRPLFQ